VCSHFDGHDLPKRLGHVVRRKLNRDGQHPRWKDEGDVSFMHDIGAQSKNMFDKGVRASRRLEELRQMMSVVWECSSDAIVISVRGWDGRVTNMLSPTFLRFEGVLKLKFVPWCLSKANRSLQNTRMRRINHPSNPVHVEDYTVLLYRLCR
jgi:hypothetical protein